MLNLEIINIYYRQKKNINEYLDILFETSNGLYEAHGARISYATNSELNSFDRLHELAQLRKKHGTLYIVEARATYDQDLFLLISGRFILAIEYRLNSNFLLSVQGFRVIKDLDSSNKSELDEFYTLDVVESPPKSV